mmetsp:Transcript_34576/g.75453  ORF Transcript_34576/g.75453 Transcript_34576/m.75453 type:complete len:278 (-) Transcript_34576:908-1741(-)
MPGRRRSLVMALQDAGHPRSPSSHLRTAALRTAALLASASSASGLSTPSEIHASTAIATSVARHAALVLLDLLLDLSIALGPCLHFPCFRCRLLHPVTDSCATPIGCAHRELLLCSLEARDLQKFKPCAIPHVQQFGRQGRVAPLELPVLLHSRVLQNVFQHLQAGLEEGFLSLEALRCNTFKCRISSDLIDWQWSRLRFGLLRSCRRSWFDGRGSCRPHWITRQAPLLQTCCNAEAVLHDVLSACSGDHAARLAIQDGDVRDAFHSENATKHLPLR